MLEKKQQQKKTLQQLSSLSLNRTSNSYELWRNEAWFTEITWYTLRTIDSGNFFEIAITKIYICTPN